MRTVRLAIGVLLLGLPMGVGCSTSLPGFRRDEDPVCEREVPVVDWAITREYRGQKLYFDSEACARKFDADPDPYYWRYERDRVDAAWWDEDEGFRPATPEVPDR